MPNQSRNCSTRWTLKPGRKFIASMACAAWLTGCASAAAPLTSNRVCQMIPERSQAAIQKIEAEAETLGDGYPAMAEALHDLFDVYDFCFPAVAND